MIGIFDSGSGGLSVLRAIRDRLPSADVLYFGDIKNAPYGEKPQKELSLLTVQAIQFLQTNGATSIVSACNSVSASLAISLFDTLDLSSNSMIEMVGPIVNSFRHTDKRILLCATPATIHSGIYQNGFSMIGKEIMTVAIPELAGAIEFGVSEKEIEQIISQVFSNTENGTFDTLILGCTHYPLVTHIFARVLGSSVNIVDPSDAVAERVEEKFWPREARDGKLSFAITKDSLPFRDRVANLFPQSKEAIRVIK